VFFTFDLKKHLY